VLGSRGFLSPAILEIVLGAQLSFQAYISIFPWTGIFPENPGIPICYEIFQQAMTQNSFMVLYL
jgi:hypothetical protein